MSILIEGMEMPSNCGECPMICEHDLCLITKGGRTLNERPPHCPLIEIPPHGRLIDADDLLAMVKRAMEDDDMYEDDYRDVRDWLAVAPTVIEAEGGWEQ